MVFVKLDFIWNVKERWTKPILQTLGGRLHDAMALIKLFFVVVVLFYQSFIIFLGFSFISVFKRYFMISS